MDFTRFLLCIFSLALSLFPINVRAFPTLTTQKESLEKDLASVQQILVHLRIEGPWGVLYDGLVHTDEHVILTVSGGMHQCNGMNNHAHKTSGPTATGALDDASAAWGFNYDA